MSELACVDVPGETSRWAWFWFWGRVSPQSCREAGAGQHTTAVTTVSLLSLSATSDCLTRRRKLFSNTSWGSQINSPISTWQVSNSEGHAIVLSAWGPLKSRCYNGTGLSSQWLAYIVYGILAYCIYIACILYEVVSKQCGLIIYFAQEVTISCKNNFKGTIGDQMNGGIYFEMC